MQHDAKDQHTKNVQRQFNRQAQAYAQTRQAKDLKAMQRLCSLLETHPNTNSLDVACGPGRLTMALAGLCKHAHGLDATEGLLAIAQQEAAELGLQNIAFGQGSALDMPYPSNSFDVVTCRAAFHHFAQPQKVFSEMVRVTKAKGQILIADILGNPDPDKSSAHDHIERLCDPSHFRCIPEDEFIEMFNHYDISVEKALRNSMSYKVNEWILHGGPDAAAELEIRRLFEEDLTASQTGLQVELIDQEYSFSHQTIVFVLRKN